jgi:hypothetical protein
MDKRNEHIELGEIDIPKEYAKFNDKQKKAICYKLIDTLLYDIDRYLDPKFNRITFLEDVLKSSLMTNEELENFEVAQVLLDCLKHLND